MRWVKRRAELARNDLRIAWTLARLAWVRCRIWVHCALLGISPEEFRRRVLLGISPEEFRRRVRLKRLMGC